MIIEIKVLRNALNSKLLIEIIHFKIHITSTSI